MMIELTDEQREIVSRLIRREISDLGPEIRHTESYDWRDDLKAQKHTLRDLLGQIEGAPTA